MSELSIETRRVTTADGWELELRSTRCPDRLRKDSLPVLFIPGYGMNNFILGFHPRGTSLEQSLAQSGFEVWSVNMRGQGDSRPRDGRVPEPSITGFVRQDVPAAVNRVLADTHTDGEQLVLAGCSLGGTVVYAYAGIERDDRVAAMVTIGGPLRWDEVHPLLGLAYKFPRVVGKLRLRGARKMARVVLPLAARLPRVLDIYMNTSQIDLSSADQMVNTVDDLFPGVNEQIARWIQSRDLILEGQNVTEALGGLDVPLLLVLANKDGIVPEGSVMPARGAWGGDDVEVLRVGTEKNWYAHADLFISDHAPITVFEPMAAWLARKAMGS